jgi:septal ring-binding cell division protein DamX
MHLMHLGQSTRRIGMNIIVSLFCLFLSTATVFAEPGSQAAPALLPSVPTQSDDIFSYPKHYYAVQLMAVKDKRLILEFITKYQLGDPPYGALLSKGERWEVLLLGVYPDRATAEQAIQRLPADFPIAQPWIRPLGPLQEAILRANPR